MKRIYKVILGTTGVPLTTVGALGYHIYHRHFIQTPDPIKIQVTVIYSTYTFISCTLFKIKYNK